ncbi:MAG: MaoC family dehydratase N-terminal domain-containing protein [Xanthomonadales bacterium]|nr:MaoC family dehydratase N-terminal domain-containing protein [Xanthomonadales bacterium]
MTDPSAIIGHRFPAFEMTLEPGRVALFREAIGEPAQAEPGDLVPPTLLGFGFEPVPFDALDVFGLDIARLLHAEQELIHHKPCRVGERLKGQKEITNVFEKKGGALLFVTLKLTYRDEADELMAESIQTLVVRQEVAA